MQTLADIIFWTPLVYLLLINLVAFVAMWWDKRKARQNEWRVAEATLHILGILGGAIGGILAGSLLGLLGMQPRHGV